MADAGSLHGVALLQRGSENLTVVAGGTTGSDPDTGCTPATRFQIASVSKQFTAAAVLLLADRGILSVDDPVRNWLDDCPAAWEPVTVHHLLSHSSGLIHWKDLPGLDLTKPATTGELLSSFASVPLLSPPGERFSYSSPGYVLLGQIIEQAAGQPYGAFLTHEIFQPLGLTATFTGNPRGEPDLSAGHHDGKAVSSFELDTVNLGTGGIWSTAVDLARWDRALASGQILSSAARRSTCPLRTTTASSAPRATVTAGSSAPPPAGTGSFIAPATSPGSAPSTHGFPTTTCAWPCSATRGPPASTRSSTT